MQAGPAVSLTWDPDPDPIVVGFRFHSGTTSGVFTQVINVGDATRGLVSNLVGGKICFFAVTAYEANGVESSPSNESSYAAPVSTPTPIFDTETHPETPCPSCAFPKIKVITASKTSLPQILAGRRPRNRKCKTISCSPRSSARQVREVHIERYDAWLRD